ncbi:MULTISPECIES: metallophosphoesterase [unclassified Fusibacter]|uniref:metallophosphoesterase n=1 Tax=unclassified Fusibacter TaxID=2624464 RepID=UPI0013E8FBA9|nr:MULTISPECIES: metallophosphoesterase [unclassified Fusibacter]MCK8060476.1 metallophosphoesterase [Fusibacter sp. A2]NPE20235.1 metallophosphoesterase [Fusibacter sp. A1]
MMKRKQLLFIVAILSVLLIGSALDRQPVVKNYKVTLESLKDKQLRIVQISDLHSTNYGIGQTLLIEMVIDEAPDLIVMTGDIFDDIVPNDSTVTLLDGIKRVAPIIYVTGNHEIWSDDLSTKLELLTSRGVHVLHDTDKVIVIGETLVRVVGFDDPYAKGYLFDGDKSKLSFESKDTPVDLTILLSHRAELVDVYKSFDADLSLSGHSHGGQVRIPFLINGLLSPNQGWFPEYAGGVYKVGELSHIVSRGLSINERLPRIFNPPELVVVDVSGH